MKNTERMVQKSLRFPETLATWLEFLAEKDSRSFNKIVVLLLEGIKQDRPPNRSIET